MKHSAKIEVVQGDITRIKVDAVVNAANSSLLGGGGVDGAIHRAGGNEILKECLQIVSRQGGCPTGEAVITTAGKLPATYVIHTVGPVWHGGEQNEANLLKLCYKNSLQLATEHQCSSIAFPNISTGVYHFPKALAAKISIEAIREFLTQESSLKKIMLVCFDAENYYQVQEALEIK